MANVIEQIVQPKNFGSQTIEMNVRSNERGPQGEQGEQGEAATVNAGDVYTIGYGQTPQVLNRGTSGDAILDFYLPEGKPGAIHYTAGPGISITDDNVIEATGGMAVYWGNIKGTLSNQTDLNNALNAKQNKLTAGTNITISGNTISSKNYTAGNGLNLNGGEFSVNTNTIQTKLTAGSNVQINSGTISATDTTYNNFIGADGGSGGSAGLVPAPVASDNVKVLKGDGTWGTVGSSSIDRLSLLNFFYPVGSYYETSDVNFNPNTSWGGTWVEDTKGRVTVAKSDSGTFNIIGSTGGAETNTYNFNHTHAQSIQFTSTYVMGSGLKYTEGGVDTVPNAIIANNQSNWDGIPGVDVGSKIPLGNKSISTVQPYIVVRRWHRTA